MMSLSSAPRTYQRRQGSPPEVSAAMSAMDPAQQQQSQGRSVSGASTATARTHGSRSSNPDKQISQIEKSVTHLLVATKQLLETLTQWSRGNAQEEEVSDVYVRLGYEFNLACRAFNSIGVDTTDLGPVPDLLRTILEDTLSQPASPQALDNYLPRIRDIIINLLQGLKRKQSKLRSRPPKEAPTGSKNGQPSRQMSAASASSDPTAAVLPDDSLTPSRESPVPTDPTFNLNESELSQPKFERSSLRRSIRRDPQPQIPSSDSTSTLSSTTAQNLPVLSPATQAENANVVAGFPYAPPPPPKQDALTALQRGGDLERRASRRFSAYQIQKHLGASPNGVPVIPPAQNSPVPNRGREARESMRAVTSRTSYLPNRQKSGSNKLSPSPSRSGAVKHPQTITEEREPPSLDTEHAPKLDPPGDRPHDDSPLAKTPDEYFQPKDISAASPAPQLGATVNGPFSPSKETLDFGDAQSQESGDGRAKSPSRGPSIDEAASSATPTPQTTTRPSATPPPTTAIDLDSSPASIKELTLFLQYKTRVKKFVLPGGYGDLTLARLQLAFIEKFAWNTHNNGVDLPEIYIQDPVSGVRHELEDLADVKDRSVLVLNVEVLDEVKKHFDEGLGGLKNTLDGVRSILDGQSTMMQRFSDRQLDASKEMARLSAAPPPRVARAPVVESNRSPISPTAAASDEQLQEVANLRRDIAVLRQTYSSMSADFAASMQNIKLKATNVKTAAEQASIPSYEGNAGRKHVNDGKKTLNTDSEALVNRVDNLTDTVEDLRKDVVSRGVRPRPNDLEVLSKEIASVSKDLARLKDFMRREKPIWTKIWEAELNLVCTERDDLTQQEDLMADLHGDLEDVQNVFNLVEEAMKQQALQGNSGSLRQASKTVEIDPSVDPSQAKEGVLDEVRALRPNHEDRLEAIERAERQRRKDLENRRANEFQRELESFVEEGKMKKTGGMDEVERMRKLKDERAMKENWATQMAIEEEKARKRAEREAKKAAAAKAAAAAEAEAQLNGGPTEDASQNASNAEPVLEVSAVPSNGDGANDTIQGEAEPSFHDAPTATSPTPAGVSGADGDDEKDEAPKLPQVDIDSSAATDADGDGKPSVDTKDDDVEATSPMKDKEKKDVDRNSWWKPAVF